MSKDRVGSSVPTTEQVQNAVGKLGESEDVVKDCTIQLTSEERSRTTKMRPDGDWVVNRVAELATAHGVALPGISVDGMRNDLKLAQELGPLANKASALHQRLDDTILAARSECWWAATAYYTTLVRMADTDPALADAIKPVVDYFAVGKRKKAEPK